CAAHPSSTRISSLYGKSSTFMSPSDHRTSEPSPQYDAWLRRERLRGLRVLLGQAGVLLTFLLAWELLARLQVVNPFLTSYPSAIGPTFLPLLKSTPQQASILTHTLATLSATLIGLALAMIFGTAIAAALWWWEDLQRIADPYLVVANAMPK